VRRAKECGEIIERADGRIDTGVIGDVIAAIPQRGGVNGRRRDRLNEGIISRPDMLSAGIERGWRLFRPHVCSLYRLRTIVIYSIGW
jgi:hypothetical protein